MSLSRWIPPDGGGRLARNGYALTSDLEDPSVRSILTALEGFQAEFLGRTRSLWDDAFPIPGDALAHFTRQWEFPYAWAAIAGRRGRVLDAGSGITFFPFLLAAAGFDVDCCDADFDGLDLAARFASAAALTGCDVSFEQGLLTDLPYPDAAFDAVVCISVLEHTGLERLDIVRSLARVVRPGGRLVVTCDVSLGHAADLPVEELAVILAELEGEFTAAHPLDLTRPAALLTSDLFLTTAPWRLPPPWRPTHSDEAGPRAARAGHGFRSIAVVGLTADRKA